MSKQTLERIHIDNLKLDLDNPRLPKSRKGLDEKSVIEWMLLQAATTELMLAIADNDFFEGELLLVVPEMKKVGKKVAKTGNFTVVEGNRRLTAVKLLNNPELTTKKISTVREIAKEANFKPTVLPCLVFQDETKILKYLGFRHITGIKAWRLLEKARYLFELKERDFSHLDFLPASKEIAKMIGSTSAYVKRLLLSFQLYKEIEEEDFYDIEGLNDVKFHLNYFTDGLIKENIRNFLGVKLNHNDPLKYLKKENLKQISYWWFEKHEGQPRVYGDSNGLKKLDKVLANDRALEAFAYKGKSIDESYELTGEINLQFQSKIKQSLKSIEDADYLSNKITDFYSELYDDLKTIRRIAGKINEYKKKIEQEGDDF